jgi:hypothetical protein
MENHKKYMKILSLVKLGDPSINSIQAQNKAKTLWQAVKKNQTGYHEMIIKLESKNATRKAKNCSAWSRFVKKPENNQIGELNEFLIVFCFFLILYISTRSEYY